MPDRQLAGAVVGVAVAAVADVGADVPEVDPPPHAAKPMTSKPLATINDDLRAPPVGLRIPPRPLTGKGMKVPILARAGNPGTP